MNENIYILTGIAYPETALLNLGEPLTGKIRNSNTRVVSKIETQIINNQITVFVNSQDTWDIFQLKKDVHRMVTDQLNILGYLMGYAYHAELRQVALLPWKPEDKPQIFVYGVDFNSCIMQRNKVQEIGQKFDELICLFATEPPASIHIRRCIYDLTFAIKEPDDAPFYCYRALESLRHYCGVYFDIEKEPEQWKKLSEITGYGKNDIEIIRKYAFPIRHGNILNRIPPEDKNKIIERTWDVVDAFLEKAKQMHGIENKYRQEKI